MLHFNILCYCNIIGRNKGFLLTKVLSKQYNAKIDFVPKWDLLKAVCNIKFKTIQCLSNMLDYLI